MTFFMTDNPEEASVTEQCATMSHQDAKPDADSYD